MDLTELMTPKFSLMIRAKGGEYELGLARLPEEELCFDAGEYVQIENLKPISIWFEPAFLENSLGYRPREIQLPHQKHFIVSVDHDYSKIHDEKRIVINYVPLVDETEQERREFVMTTQEMENVIDKSTYDCTQMNKFMRSKAREQTGNRRKILTAIVNTRQALKEAREAEGYENIPHDVQEAFTYTINEPIGNLSEKLYARSLEINKKRVRMALKNYAYVRGIGEDIDWNYVA